MGQFEHDILRELREQSGMLRKLTDEARAARERSDLRETRDPALANELREASSVLRHAIDAQQARLLNEGFRDPYLVVDEHGTPVIAPLLAAYCNALAALARPLGAS